MPAFIDLTGRRFGRWFVVGRVEGSKPALWNLRCDCGREVVRPSGNLARGGSKSCGCRTVERNRSRRVDPIAAFWTKVKKDGPALRDGLGPCWVWIGARDELGYGSINRRTYGEGSAHRYSWVLHNGAIEPGRIVMHHCDNPGCVRPEHLALGTHQDNMNDKVQKQRQARGETHGDRYARGSRHGAATHPEKFRGEGNCKAKLTEAQVAEIRARVGRRNGAALAREFGVNKTTINAIKHGRIWPASTAQSG